MKLEIQKVNENDTRRLLEIYSYYVLNTAISFEWDVPTENEFRNRITSISSKYPYIKAVIDGKIVGYAYANTFKSRRAYDWAVETTIYIDKDYKGQGIGKTLYNKLEELLKEMGVLNINACIASPNGDDKVSDNSIKFHTAMGYNLVGKFTKVGYKFNSWYDMVWMEKIISEHTDNQSEVKLGEWKI